MLHARVHYQLVIRSVPATMPQTRDQSTLCLFASPRSRSRVQKWQNGKLAHPASSHCSPVPQGRYRLNKLFPANQIAKVNYLFCFIQQSSSLFESRGYGEFM